MANHPEAIARFAALPEVAEAHLPVNRGAYLLVVRLNRYLELDIPSLATAKLSPGWYVYAGSARGPGGIRARVGRHLRAVKSIHWHIDHLSLAASQSLAYAVPGGRECVLLQAMLSAPGFSVPILGFGSSDCRKCPSHLLKVSL
jgi:Uri superfamily endonuclease